MNKPAPFDIIAYAQNLFPLAGMAARHDPATDGEPDDGRWTQETQQQPENKNDDV